MSEQWEAGQRLKEAREALGMSKRQAAAEIGVSEGWWRMMELGTKPLKGERVPVQIPSGHLYRAALVLNLDPEELIALGGDMVKHDEAGNKIQEITEKLHLLKPRQLEIVNAFIDGLRFNR